MPRDPQLTRAQEAAETWIAASIRLHHICGILEDIGEPDPEGRTKSILIVQIAHFQYATELPYSRLFAARNSEDPPSGRAFSLAPAFTGAAEAHQLVVAASGFWRTLRELCDFMPFPDLVALLNEETDTIADTQAARNHMEHIAERIIEGRRPQRGFSKMPKEVFQAAIGRLQFPEIVFGTEVFNLDGIASAILSVGSQLSSAFSELFKDGIGEFNSALFEVVETSG